MGDDDTVFFLDAARALVQGLDPSIPYILADVVSFCSPGEHCKVDKICSLPRNAPPADEAPPAGAPGNGSSCVRSPAVEPCTRAALEAPGTCNLPPPWYGLPFPCGRNGALISRGMMNVFSSQQWRERCEEPNTLHGGGELRVYKCLWDAGYAMTDPTPGDDPSFCTMGFLHPDTLMTTARAVAAANGSCDAACDRALHRTVSLSVDPVGDDKAQYVRDLHAAMAAAGAAMDAGLVSALPAEIDADAAALAAALAGAGIAGPFVCTLTTSNKHRWRLFLNWLVHARPQRRPLVVFTSDARTQALCERALAAAAAHAGPAAAVPSLCFLPAATLGRIDLAPGADNWQDSFWKHITAVAKPLTLALAAGTGRDVVFAETDVLLRGDVLSALAARTANATMTCSTQRHERAKGLPLPDGNVGVLFFRGADARLPPLLRAQVLNCAPRWARVDDQAELIAALSAVQQPDDPAAPFFDCVDSSDGFTTACCDYNATAGFAVHVAGVAATEGKIAWMMEHGLWHEHTGALEAEGAGHPDASLPPPAPLPPAPAGPGAADDGAIHIGDY